MSLGTSLGRIFKEDEIVGVVDSIMDYYKRKWSGERICKTMDRIGQEKFINDILHRI